MPIGVSFIIVKIREKPKTVSGLEKDIVTYYTMDYYTIVRENKFISTQIALEGYKLQHVIYSMLCCA